jgi:hypothetical protein
MKTFASLSGLACALAFAASASAQLPDPTREQLAAAGQASCRDLRDGQKTTRVCATRKAWFEYDKRVAVAKSQGRGAPRDPYYLAGVFNEQLSATTLTASTLKANEKP